MAADGDQRARPCGATVWIAFGDQRARPCGATVWIAFGLVALHGVLVAPGLAQRYARKLSGLRRPRAPVAPAYGDPPDLRAFVEGALERLPPDADLIVDPARVPPHSHSVAFLNYYLYPRRVYLRAEPRDMQRFPLRPAERPVYVVLWNDGFELHAASGPAEERAERRRDGEGSGAEDGGG